MFSENQIVLTKLGLMKVISVEDKTIELLDPNGNKRSFIMDKVSSLPFDLLEIIRSNKLLDSFSAFTIEKGREYYLNKAIMDYNYDEKNNTISAMVNGTFIYNTIINISTKEIDCSCPVSGLCKHSAAVLIALNSDLMKLDLLNAKNYLMASESSSLINLNLLINTDDLNIELIKALAKINENNYSYVFTSLFNEYLLKPYYRDIILHNLKYVLYNESLYSYLREYFNNHLNDYRLLYQIYVGNKNNISDNLIYLATNKKPNAINYLLSHYNEKYLDYFTYFLSISSSKEEIINEIFATNSYKLLNALTDSLISLEYSDFLLYIKNAFNHYYSLDIDASVLKKFKVYRDIRFMPLMASNPDSVSYFLVNFNVLFKENPMACLDFYLKNKYYHQSLRSDTFYKKYDLGELDILFKHSFIGYSVRAYHYDEIIPYYREYPSFLKYHVIENDNSFDVLGYAYSYLYLSFTVFYDDASELTVNYHKLPTILESYEKGKDELPFLSYLKATNTIDLDGCILRLKNKRKEIILRARTKALEEAIADFSLSFDNKEKSMLQTSPLSLELYFDDLALRDLKHKRSNILRLKIGNDKMYYVKSLKDFMLAFNNNEYISYGKNLAFYHNTDSFKPEYKKVLDYLLILLSNSDRDKLILSNDELLELLKLYQGHYLYYLNKPYLVSLENKELKCILNSDYSFKANLNLNNSILANTALIILDSDNIYLSSFKRSEQALIDLMLKLEGENLELIKDKFIKEVYSRIPNRIEVSDELKDEINIYKSVIKAYFDYHDDLITLMVEVLENDKLIDASKASYQTRMKYEAFNKYIDSLGFINYELKDLNKIGEFFQMDFSYLRSIALVYLSDNINKLDLKEFIKPTINFSDNGESMMNVFLEDINYPEEDLVKIFKALKLKKKFIKLKDDEIISFTDDDFNYYLEYKSLGLDKESTVNIPIFNLVKYANNSNYIKVSDYLKGLTRDLNNYKDLDIPMPKLNAKLRGYQIDGYRWLKVLEKYHLGGILADEMGLGKTLEVIALLNTSENKPNLIVTPKSLSYNWLNEIRRFDSEAKVRLIIGTKDNRENLIKEIKEDEKSYNLISYDALRNHESLNFIDFNYLILDEAQYIKNFETKKSEAIRKVKAKRRLALTGTPIENNIVDLWSIFLFLMPGFFGSLEDFNSKYKNDTSALAKRIKPFILRRTKKEYLNDLPDKYTDIISSEMTDMQLKIYDSIKLEAKNQILTGDSTVFNLFRYLIRLREASISPELFLDDYKDGSGKLNELSILLDELIIDKHKIIIFSQFVKALNLIEEILKKKNINYLMITGKTSAKARIDIVDEFNASNDVEVILISLKAGGTGLNLTSADTVIHLDPWWNLAVENQATDRAHRIGQTKNVRVIKMISEGSVEERVIDLQNRKRDLFESVVEDNASDLGKLTEEDIKYILS